MEPRDLQFDTVTLQANHGEASSDCISSHHPTGPAVVFADRITAYRLRQPLSPSKLKSLLTIAGGEDVKKEDLARRHPRYGVYLSEASE